MALSNVSSTANLSNTEELTRTHVLPEAGFNSIHKNTSAISWAAILAGAVAAATLSLILLLLGTGLGLSSVSPWANKGVSASTFGVSTIVWITVTQIIASGMGGYLAGRLRIRWAGVDTDEVYFRDTAHGFLSWAVATLVTAVMLASVVSSIVRGGVQAAATVTGSAATAAVAAGSEVVKTDNPNGSATGVMGYFADALFRKNVDMADAGSTGGNVVASDDTLAATSEVARIFVNSFDMPSLPASDLAYISQLVSSRTGLTEQEAEKRVTDIYASMQAKVRNAEIAAKQAAEKARKASIYTTLWLFVSLLMGAFSASLSATCGGRCRDGCA
ncbi:hypothetical protein [Methylotenera sp.]|uniref:hypothetical protein n=1 Tax=Methylotenera sp. TaxID=2051956 RepID=UPI002ED99DFB